MPFLIYNGEMLLSWVIAGMISLPVTAAYLWLGHWIMWKIPILHGPVFIPSNDASTDLMLKMAQLQEGERLADLGSGNGKIVIAAAQKGALSDGFENSPTLVYQSRKKIKNAGLTHQARIYLKSFWSADLSQYDVITLYTSVATMPKLEQKLLRELKPGARVVSNTFAFPHWPCEKQRGNIFLYLRK